MITLAQSNAINSVGPNYSINFKQFEARDEMEDCEQLAEGLVAEATDFTVRKDLGGITVYLKGNALVAFYDYERFVGHVF
jgi:hypothetical protein